MNYSDWSEDTKEKNRIRTLANYHRKVATKRSESAEKAMQDRRRATPKPAIVRLCQLPTCEQPLGTHIQGQPHDYCCWAHYRQDFMRAYNVKIVPFLPACERRRR